MRKFSERDLIGTAFAPQRDRLETPSMTGYRSGMSSFGVICRKLPTVYSAPSDTPEEIDAVLVKLDRTLASRAD